MSFWSGLYTGLYLPAAPLIAGFLAGRPDSRRRWRDYLGRNRFEGDAPSPGGIWVHAVSAGEALSAVPLVRALGEAVPGLVPSVLTTTIKDALDVVARRVSPVYPSRTFLPLDVPCFLRRLFDRIRPRLLVLSETDLWPNLLLEAGRRRVPVYLVNGRISPGAGRGYRLVRALLEPALQSVRLAFVQSEADGARLAGAGLPPQRLRVRPNTKYERPEGPPPSRTSQAEWLRTAGRPVLIAGSTHAPEEALVLEAARGLGNALVVLVPRNPERAREVLAASGPGALLWSQRPGQGVPAETTVVVVDTMGELDLLYPAADVVVVGGSFGEHHGHNFLEPAWHARPIVCGPDMANFASDVALFEREGALRQVADGVGLRSALSELLAGPRAASELGQRARALVESAQGVSARLAAELAADLAAFEEERKLPRVLFCVSSAGLGGGERHALTLMRELERGRHATVALSCRGGGWLEDQARAAEIPVVLDSYSCLADVVTLVRLWSRLRSGCYDLVHTHLNLASWLGGLAARAAGVPIVATAHGLTRGLYYRPANRILAVSQAVARHLSDGSRELGRRTEVVYSGLPELPPADPLRVAELRHLLGIAPEEPVVLTVGKLHPNKGQRVLLEAARRLDPSRPWRLVLVGSGPDAVELGRRARPLGERVVMAGELDEPSTVLAVADLLVLPSHREAFGLVVLEAQMAGVPVVASDTGGVRELIEDGRTGRLFPPGDAERLAELLDEVLRDPTPIGDLARAARESCRRFSVAAMVEGVTRAYRRALGDVLE